MPEDSGKKRFIKDFLVQVKSGVGLIEDIRIERTIRKPGTDGTGSTAISLSGREVNNLSQLLNDDIRHTFDDGYFTFRSVAAHLGSGKTTLLNYLRELIQTKPICSGHAVIVQFQFTDINQGPNYAQRLYCFILADWFWQLLNNKLLSIQVKEAAEKILKDYLDLQEVPELKSTESEHAFRNKCGRYLTKILVLEDFFFEVISAITAVDPSFVFVCLADELDGSAEFPNVISETRLLLKQLVRKAFDKYKSRIRILIYVVGAKHNLGKFIDDDDVMKSLVGNNVINLHTGSNEEFEFIKQNIQGIIKGAYKGYKTFNDAWVEIQAIEKNTAKNLREFCQDYGNALLQIHQKYFSEAPEQIFEGDSRKLVEAQCKLYWDNFLRKDSYSLSSVSTTTIKNGHAFDAYVELLHNNYPIARAFGEAKNYHLLTSHFDTFQQWLYDVQFKPITSGEHPPDLAFMIAPSCPELLKRKLEISHIKFIESSKIVHQTPIILDTSSNTSPEELSLNSATRTQLVNVLKGSRIKAVTIDKLIQNRPYKSATEMFSILNLSGNAKKFIQTKLDSAQISL
jgi:hypothetical protein